ncbi:MAG: hypothetical protein QOH39_1568 [Verrucomicrobiota bacterium]
MLHAPSFLMKQIFAFLIAILMSASALFANLGDGDEVIEKSYGNMIERHLLDDGTVSVLYHRDRYLCFVIFDKSRSILETYARMDGHDLSQKEIAKFLKANAGPRGRWIRDETSKERRFERSDHKAEATVIEVKGRPTLKMRLLRNEKVKSDDR